MTEREYVELKDYVETLLKQGKRANHPDFEVLFRIFGKDKIVALAKEVLAREKLAQTDADDKLDE